MNWAQLRHLVILGINKMKTIPAIDYLNSIRLAKAYHFGGENALNLFIQILDCSPCPDCNYIKKHCRCKKSH